MQRGDKPYRLLGEELARIRRRGHETASEVSGAVEIDDERLNQFELGEMRPSEDILLLLISHFDIKDDEAARLWELAGYDGNKQSQNPSREDLSNPPQTLMVMPFDARVVYTDRVHVMINNYGVVMNFMQNSGNTQPLPVARVGMSLEHAKSVLEVLEKTIAQASQTTPKKFLPLPKSSKSNKQKSS